MPKGTDSTFAAKLQQQQAAHPRFSYNTRAPGDDFTIQVRLLELGLHGCATECVLPHAAVAYLLHTAACGCRLQGFARASAELQACTEFSHLLSALRPAALCWAGGVLVLKVPGQEPRHAEQGWVGVARYCVHDACLPYYLLSHTLSKAVFQPSPSYPPHLQTW